MRFAPRLLFAALLIAIAAYGLIAWRGLMPGRYDVFAPLDPTETPSFLTGFKLWRISGDYPACIAALRRSGADFSEVPVHTETLEPGCELRDTVLISKFSQAVIAPEEMRCDIALRLYLHERHDIQPLARKYFSVGVSRLHHLGSYSCRKIRGGRRMSQHATANAFDLAGYRLADGRDITLKNGWKAGGAKSAFLRELHTRACLVFNLVLSPDFNAGHAGHFHFDMGGYKACR